MFIKTVLMPLVLAAAILSFFSFQDQFVSIMIHGTVTTDDGEVVTNSELQLSFMKILIDENELPQQTDERVVVTTNGEGRYSIRVNIDPDWSDFLLRLSTSGLDQIHYLEPAPKQLTERIRTGIESGSFEFEVNWVVESRPRWLELKREIDRFGEDSAKGRTLRQYGFPDRIEETTWKGENRVIWFYYSEGFAVRFLGEKQDKIFRFKPRQYRPPQQS